MESQYRRAKQMALSGKADAAARKHNVGLDNLKASFAKLDTNNDGFISREELTKVLCTLGPVPLGKDEAVQLFDLADTNGDGVIDHEELAALLGSGISVRCTSERCAVQTPCPLSTCGACFLVKLLAS